MKKTIIPSINLAAQLKQSKAVILLLLTLCITIVAGAQTPTWEFGKISGDGNPTGNGPAYTTTINMLRNQANPSNSVFTQPAPALSATVTLSNQQYNHPYISGGALAMGHQLAAATIYTAMNAAGVPGGVGASNNYTTASTDPILAGQGIDLASNHAIRITMHTGPLLTANAPATGSYYAANMTITFNRTVNNPVLHIGGAGGGNGNSPNVQGFCLEFEDISSNVPISLTKLSGTNTLSATGNRIYNNQSDLHDGTTGEYKYLSGSVRVNGKGITSITIKVHVRGDGGIDNTANHWGGDMNGDAFLLSLSVPAASDLAVTKTVNIPSPTVGQNVIFTINATNNGPDNDAGVEVQDLLPAGYTYVSHTATNGNGTYNTGTGLWSIGALNAAASQTLTITATLSSIKADYFNLATISGDNFDPNPANNSAGVLGCSSGPTAVNLNNLFTGTVPPGSTLVWFTTSDRQPGTQVATPTNITTSGYYYAFFLDGSGNYNTTYSTAGVNVIILPSCPRTDLAITKSVNNPAPLAGNQVTFTITATNNGPSAATGVRVTENIPTGYSVVSITPSAGTSWAAPTWTIGNLANGASATLTVVATVNTTGVYANTVTITGNEIDPTSGNNTDTETPAVNRAPVAVNNTYTVAEDGMVTLTPLSNDTDADGHTLTISSINGVSRTPGIAQSIPVTNGMVNITAGGAISFTPAANYNGSVSFPYVISDGNGGTATANINITVNPVNDPPVAVNDSYIVGVNNTEVLTPLVNDTDVDGNPLAISSVNGVTRTPGVAQSIPVTNGTVNITAGGVINFTPALNYIGNVTFPYVISDGTTTATASINITISILVPVKLLHFTAAETGNRNVLLTWATAVEQNNKGFAIERSADGIRWNAIGFVNTRAVNGNGNNRLDYTFEDRDPFITVNYYRLKQVDIDGKETYSKAETVSPGENKLVHIYPNPATDFIMIKGLSPGDLVILTNLNGNILLQKKPVSSPVRIALAGLPGGIYTVQVIAKNGKRTIRNIAIIR